METKSVNKAENIRDVIRYLQKFKNAVIVIYLDDKTIQSSLYSSHISDIALLHQAGLKVVLIPGARNRIDEVLSLSKIDWTYHENTRVTEPNAMPLIKMAAFDVSNTIMTSLAANNITAVIGNWVRSRAKGIINGFDFLTVKFHNDIADLNTGTFSAGIHQLWPSIGMWALIPSEVRPASIAASTISSGVFTPSSSVV